MGRRINKAMNMFLHEMKSFRKFTTIWSFILCLWIILLSLLFPNFSQNAAEIKKVLEGYPEAVRDLVGLSIDSFTNFLSFYTFAFKGIIELGAVQAMILGATIIFKEVRGKTSDFLFTKPITRGQIITSKLLAAAASLGITNGVYLIVSSIMAALVSSEPVIMKTLFIVSITLFFVQLIFMSFGILIAVLFPRMKSATAVSIGALFFYMIIYDILKPVIGEHTVRYIIPFEYFSREYIIKNASYETPFVILTIIIITASLAASCFLYSRKDVHAA
jgi:ABC-2 type transport system permease protein